MSDLSDSVMLKTGIGSEFGLSPSSGYRYSFANSDPFPEASFTVNGRAALALAARFIIEKHGRGREVLLPAYLCHSMIQPFEEAGFEVCFYRVEADLTIELSAITSEINERTTAVVLMHYFGFEQPQLLRLLLAQSYPDLTILDDRTHLLLSDMHSGAKRADHAIDIYSARKWGPFPDLGIVVWPEHLTDFLLPDSGYDMQFAMWRLWGIFLRTLFFMRPNDRLRQLSLQYVRWADDLIEKRIAIRRASPIALFLWRHWQWQDTWHRRRQNYQYLLDQWPCAWIKPLFTRLSTTACPLGFPIRCDDRDNLKSFLISRDVFPPVHWQRPQQVSAEKFPDAALLSQEELTLPIDQRYDTRHMDHILTALSQA